MPDFTLRNQGATLGVGNRIGLFKPGVAAGGPKIAGAELQAATVLADGSVTFVALAYDTAFAAFEPTSNTAVYFRTNAAPTGGIGGVSSVNGAVGDVALSAADVGAAAQYSQWAPVQNTGYSPVSVNNNRIVPFDDANPLPVLLQLADGLPPGHSEEYFCKGTGGVSLTAEVGVTIIGSPARQIWQGQSLIVTKYAENTWAVAGGPDDSAKLSLPNVFTSSLQVNAPFGIYAAGTPRIPVAINPTIDGPTAVANGTENIVAIGMTPTIQGNFTGIGGSDPGFAWCYTLFGRIAGDVVGLTDITAANLELAILTKKGHIAVVRGAQSKVGLFGPAAGAQLGIAESHRSNAPIRDGATTTFTANTTSGSAILASPSSMTNLAVGNYVAGAGIPKDTTITSLSPLTMSRNATATATGVSVVLGEIQNAISHVFEKPTIGTDSNFSARMDGILRMQDRLDAWGEIANAATGDLVARSGFGPADGAELTLFKAGAAVFPGHLRAGLSTASAEFHVWDGTAMKFRVNRSGSIGVFGAAPPSQPTLNAAATDLATTQALTNQIRAALISYGLAV